MLELFFIGLGLVFAIILIMLAGFGLIFLHFISHMNKHGRYISDKYIYTRVRKENA